MAITVPGAQTRRATGRPRHAKAAPAASTSNDTVGRDYWLAHCEGYRVDGHEGRIGFVDEVRVEHDRTVLAVRAGVFGRRVLLVSSNQVAIIVPQAQRIWLRTPTTILGSESAGVGEGA